MLFPCCWHCLDLEIVLGRRSQQCGPSEVRGEAEIK